MSNKKLFISIAAVLGFFSVASLLSACCVYPETVCVVGYVEPDPILVPAPPPDPPVVVVQRPAPPHHTYVWIDGHWSWTGDAWLWVHGYWAPPRPGYYWEPPRVVQVSGQGYGYVQGHWEKHHDAYPPEDSHRTGKPTAPSGASHTGKPQAPSGTTYTGTPEGSSHTAAPSSPEHTGVPSAPGAESPKVKAYKPSAPVTIGVTTPDTDSSPTITESPKTGKGQPKVIFQPLTPPSTTTGIKTATPSGKVSGTPSTGIKTSTPSGKASGKPSTSFKVSTPKSSASGKPGKSSPSFKKPKTSKTGKISSPKTSAPKYKSKKPVEEFKKKKIHKTPAPKMPKHHINKAKTKKVK